jgi:hypothetical protein
LSISETMFEMHQNGEISDEALLLYGMSGEVPDPKWLCNLEDHEREKFWNKKMSKRLGENWRERFRSLPDFLRRVVVSSRLIPKWSRDGF